MSERAPATLSWSLAVIFTKSATELAFIFCITWPRCAFTVISVMPSSPPTCLFNSPETTKRHDIPFARSKCGVTVPKLLYLRVLSES